MELNNQRLMRTTYLEFMEGVRGFTFHDKTTGRQIYRYQMYWSNMTPVQCFKKYDTKVIIKSIMI